MIPEVKFTYSPVYEMIIEEWRTSKDKYDAKAFDKLAKRIWNDKRLKIRRTYAVELQIEWGKIGNKVLRNMEIVSGFKWSEKFITCYIMESTKSFSDPMTIKISRDPDDDLESAMHELGHRLELQNRDRVNWRKYYAALKKEKVGVIHHVLLHAVLELTYEKSFGALKARKYISMYKGMPAEYKRAWAIVDKLGAQNIINDFVKH